VDIKKLGGVMQILVGLKNFVEGHSEIFLQLSPII
jgi:hypothetical protein